MSIATAVFKSLIWVMFFFKSSFLACTVPAVQPE